MERLLRAALAATMSILLVAGGSLALTQAGPDDLATLQAAPWTLSELDGQSIDASAGITAAFGADGSLAGFAGCNQYTGDYTTDGAVLSVGPIASTRKACEPAVTENENTFLDLLQNAASWSLDGAILTITATDGGALVFGGDAGEPAPFAGTDWILASISGQAVPAGITADAIFAEDFTVGGSAGCNTFAGPYTVDGDAIVIGPLAATRKLCEQDAMDVENAFLNGLEQVSTMAISGQTLTLSSADGGVELVLSAGGATAGATLTGTTWALVDLDGEPAVVADGMSVTFGEDGSIDGFGGCNQIFGDFTTDGDTIAVSGLAATRKFCEQDVMDRESLFIATLTDAQTVAIAGDELTVTASDGAELIFQAGGSVEPQPTPELTAAPTLAPGPTETPSTDIPTGGELVGPTWVLSELMDQPMPTTIIRVTIVFNADGTLTGNGGCTDYTGSYTVDGESITLAGITPADGTCDATQQGIQDGLLQVLPFIDSYTIEGGDLHLDSSFGISSVWTAE